MSAGGHKDAATADVVNGASDAASKPNDDARDARREDQALVAAAQGGDLAAFRALFDKYHRRAYAVAVGVVKNPDDARDVVQEAFIKAHRHLGSFQGNSSFFTWFYKITMNLAIDHTRRRKAARQVDYDDALKQRGDQSGDPGHLTPEYTGAEPGHTLSRKELAAKLRAALATLPEHHRQVILLREVDGLSYEEIAKIARIPKGTVMSRLFHARRKMQVALAGYVEGELVPQDQRESTDDAG